MLEKDTPLYGVFAFLATDYIMWSKPLIIRFASSFLIKHNRYFYIKDQVTLAPAKS